MTNCLPFARNFWSRNVCRSCWLVWRKWKWICCWDQISFSGKCKLDVPVSLFSFLFCHYDHYNETMLETSWHILGECSSIKHLHALLLLISIVHSSFLRDLTFTRYMIYWDGTNSYVCFFIVLFSFVPTYYEGHCLLFVSSKKKNNFQCFPLQFYLFC